METTGSVVSKPMRMKPPRDPAYISHPPGASGSPSVKWAQATVRTA